MKITLDVSKITVLTGNPGPDNVMLHVKLPDACFPYKKNELTLDFKAAQGFGECFVNAYFEMKPEIIDFSKDRIRVPFSKHE